MSNTLQNIDDDTLVAISKFKEIVTKKYDVLSFVLFGSRARGDHHESSDVDLAVILNTEMDDFVKVKMEMVDDAYEVFMITNLYVQPLPIGNENDDAVYRYINPRLLNDIREEGVEV